MRPKSEQKWDENKIESKIDVSSQNMILHH